LAPFLGGYILFATEENFFTLYVSVGIAGVTAFAIALLFLTERKLVTSESIRMKRSISQMSGGWKTIIQNTSILGVSFVQGGSILCLWHG